MTSIVFRVLILLFAMYSAPLPDAPAEQGEPVRLIIPFVVAENPAICSID